MTSFYQLREGVAIAFVILVLVLSCGLLLASTGAASAASAASSPSMPQAAANIGDTDPEDVFNESNVEIEEQLGDLIIHSYDYDRPASEGGSGDFEITLTWTGRAPETVTLTEMIELDSGGSTQITFQKQRITPEEKTTVTIDAKIRSGGTAAIMVTTDSSVENGEAVVLQDGDPTDRPAIRFGNVALGIGATAVLTGAGSFVFVLVRKHRDEYGKERIA